MNTTQPRFYDPGSAHSSAWRAQTLLVCMNLDEKFAQLTSFWFNDLLEQQKLPPEKLHALLGNGIGQVSRVGGSSTLPPAEAARTGNEIQRFLVEHTRLGIPAILHEESCCGYMGLGGTVFPQMIGLASTWEPALAGRLTDEVRRQMLAVGARQGLGPVLDIASDPRWGRTEETFGEDAFLAAQFGMAYIRGLQGEDPKQGVLATAKHFVGHSLSLGGLNCAPVQLGPRAMWEVYLAPFQAAIREAGVKSIMNAYPELDGDLVAASPALLAGLLREALGFSGLVVSDYEAILMIHTYHHMAPDLRSAAVKGLKAGIELELPTRVCYGEPLRAALEAGEVSQEEIDACVLRILETKFELGLFDEPYVDEGRVLEVFDTAQQRDLARQVAIRSMVLLKNDGLLPLKPQGTLALIGPNADAPRHLLGDYSYQSMMELMTQAPMPGSVFIDGVDEQHIQAHTVQVPSVLEGLCAYLGERAQVLYAQGCPVGEVDRSGIADAVRVAQQADVVILVLGDKAGLVPDCTCGETRDSADLGLPGVQRELAEAVLALGKPVAAVLVNGRPLALPWLHEKASAILEAWLPGEEGAAALAAVLFGDANPGGKLPITFPRSAGQLPVNYNRKPSGGRSNWYVDYVDMPASPLYPFGHGLSYTSFTYSDLQVSPEMAVPGSEAAISLTVTNRGDAAGDEVVQLYVRDEYACLPRPVKELKGFFRLSLAPGESRRLTFHLPVDLLAFYDEELALVVEGGAIQVMLGSSSEDIRLQGKFEIAGRGKTRVERRLFDCPVTLE
ncbi:MAG: glycoside hydrolase family 3 N-terminal domain-containing protein [Chloroflexota bacterium]